MMISIDGTVLVLKEGDKADWVRKNMRSVGLGGRASVAWCLKIHFSCVAVR